MSEPTLVIDGLVKKYGQLTAVDHLTFALEPGEFVGFIGPNGAGKSTTMRTIAGLLLPDGGTVQVHGVDVTKNPIEAREHVGYVPQDLELYKYLTGEELLRFVAAIRAVPQGEVDDRVQELIELADLSHARGKLIREYSGGMARKIAMAAALVARPRLLLMDESFVGLDPESTFRFRRYLEKYVADGNTVLLSSHILDMLERICSRVVVLHKGKLVADLDRAGLDARLADEGTPDLTRLYLALTDQSDIAAEI